MKCDLVAESGYNLLTLQVKHPNGLNIGEKAIWMNKSEWPEKLAKIPKAARSECIAVYWCKPEYHKYNGYYVSAQFTYVGVGKTGKGESNAGLSKRR